MISIQFDQKIHRPLAEDDPYFDCPGFVRSDTAYYCNICHQTGLLQAEENPRIHVTSDFHVYRLYQTHDPVPLLPFLKCPQSGCNVKYFRFPCDMSAHCEADHGKNPADIVWEQSNQVYLAKMCRVYWTPPCPLIAPIAVTEVEDSHDAHGCGDALLDESWSQPDQVLSLIKSSRVEDPLVPQPGDPDRMFVEAFHRISTLNPTFDFSKMSQDDLAQYCEW